MKTVKHKTTTKEDNSKTITETEEKKRVFLIESKGHQVPSATLLEKSKSTTVGRESHSATLGKKSESSTEGFQAYSVSIGDYSLSTTKGYNSIACALGFRSKVKAHDGFIIIAEYENTFSVYKLKKIHTAKVGEKILDVTIEPDKTYWFDKKGVFRIYTDEEIVY